MSIKSFSQYLNEATSGKEATFTFGRFNPPTIGHEKLIKAVSKAAVKDFFIYVSQSSDAKKNPLDYTTKIKYMRKMFPRYARQIILDKSIKTVFDILTQLYDKGYTRVTMVVGSDRVSEFEVLANKYNGVKGRHGFYNFENGIEVKSAGDRDPDADGVAGMSASKMREAAAANDFKSFSSGLPSGFKEAQQLFNDLRKAMGLKESRSFREHIQLESVSDVREAYVEGDLFNKGDLVIINKDDEVGTVCVRGANYLVVEMAGGRKIRKWIDDVRPLEETTTSGHLAGTTKKDDKYRGTDFAKLYKTAMASEELDVGDGLEAWIDDFIKSDAPQFKGKTKKERISMAIAAYKSAESDQ
jgi:hypothetical protein